jgi:hypothetical protein
MPPYTRGFVEPLAPAPRGLSGIPRVVVLSVISAHGMADRFVEPLPDLVRDRESVAFVFHDRSAPALIGF